MSGRIKVVSCRLANGRVGIEVGGVAKCTWGSPRVPVYFTIVGVKPGKVQLRVYGVHEWAKVP